MELLKEDPTDEFVHYALAQEYVKLEFYEKGLSTYLKLKDMNPEYVGLYYHLAALYVDLEEDNMAIETFDEGIRVARNIGDQHALSELMNAKMNFEIGG